jgi:hypothetical protein
MERTGYLRHQAFTCLGIAFQASDPDTVETLRVAAIRYFEQAAQLEKQKCVADIQASIGEELRTELFPTNPPPDSILKIVNETLTLQPRVAGGDVDR